MKRIILITAFFACGFFAPVFSQVDPVSPPTPQEREKGYNLVAVETAGENTITKFEMVNGKMVPKYYRVEMAQTEYGDKEHHNAADNKYYKWDNPYGDYMFVDGTKDDKNVTYYLNNTREKATERITTDLGGADINKNFVGMATPGRPDSSGGAITNKGTIGDITIL